MNLRDYLAFNARALTTMKPYEKGASGVTAGVRAALTAGPPLAALTGGPLTKKTPNLQPHLSGNASHFRRRSAAATTSKKRRCQQASRSSPRCLSGWVSSIRCFRALSIILRLTFTPSRFRASSSRSFRAPTYGSGFGSGGGGGGGR